MKDSASHLSHLHPADTIRPDRTLFMRKTALTRQCTYKRNTEPRSRNHHYRTKALSITYSGCVYTPPLYSPPYMLRAPPISCFICSPKQHLVTSTEHKAPSYVVFSTTLSPCPTYARKSSSALRTFLFVPP